MGRLEGKIAIVTGAGSGIGKATVELFRSEGATVVGADLQGADVVADAGSEDDVQALIERAVYEHGGLDIVFANAGISGGLAGIFDQTPDDWQDILRVNLIGPYLAIKQAAPNCRIFGVEPVGADSMSRSFAAGAPAVLDQVRTIADSLAPPYALPYSFGLCRRFVDEIVLIDDDAMRRAMGLLFREMKLAVEPAGAAATAALTGPLRDRLAGSRVGVIVCGSNIDAAGFTRELTTGP